MDIFDYIKYGIGIGTKTKEIYFQNLLFESGVDITVSEGADVTPLKENIHQEYMFQGGSSEYTSNVFFQNIKEKYQDSAVITISAEEGKKKYIDFSIVARSKNTRLYLLVIVESGADVQIIEQLEQQNFHGYIVDVVVEENAQCEYIINGGENRLYTFGIHTAYIKKDAKIQWYDIQAAVQLTKHSIVSTLAETGAEAFTYGIFLGQNSETYDIYTASIHKASHTVSDIVVRGVLDKKSSAVYRGLVRVEKGAKYCQGNEQEDTLLLADSAQIASIPDLEIFNNDVKCSHGVTTSHITDKKLFYFLSRGISRSDAKRLAIQAHIGPVLERLPENIKEQYTNNILKKLDQYE